MAECIIKVSSKSVLSYLPFFTRSRSLTHSLTSSSLPFLRSWITSLLLSLPLSFSFTHSLTHILIHLLTHSFVHSLTYSLTHLLFSNRILLHPQLEVPPLSAMVCIVLTVSVPHTYYIFILLLLSLHLLHTQTSMISSSNNMKVIVSCFCMPQFVIVHWISFHHCV